jgi:hypothetical protein
MHPVQQPPPPHARHPAPKRSLYLLLVRPNPLLPSGSCECRTRCAPAPCAPPPQKHAKGLCTCCLCDLVPESLLVLVDVPSLLAHDSHDNLHTGVDTSREGRSIQHTAEIVLLVSSCATGHLPLWACSASQTSSPPTSVLQVDPDFAAGPTTVNGVCAVLPFNQ